MLINAKYSSFNCLFTTRIAMLAVNDLFVYSRIQLIKEAKLN